MNSPKVHDQDDDYVPPPSYTEGHTTELVEGLYIFANRTRGTVLDFLEDPTTFYGDTQKISGSIDSQLWIVKREESGNGYTVQNLLYGSFLSTRVNVYETHLLIFRKPVGSRSVKDWRICRTNDGLFTVHCADNDKFLDIAGSGQLHRITCSERSLGREEQLWELERVSRTGQEIRKILSDWKPDLASRVFEPYPDDAQYFTLPYELRKSLLDEAGISRQGYIKYAFDYHDLVIKAKGAISSWARGRFAAGGYSLLFGVIYGEATRGPKAYNWYLASDMRSLAFLDAQTGKEYTTAALDEFSFQPVFATL